MKLFFVLALLLLAGEAGAVPWEQPEYLKCVRFDQANVMCFGTSLAALEVMGLTRSLCEQQMEAAMRAMEPWIAFDSPTLAQIETRWQELDLPIKQRMLWNAAKQCWRGP